jgi:hypothetical protein
VEWLKVRPLSSSPCATKKKKKKKEKKNIHTFTMIITAKIHVTMDTAGERRG